LRPATRAPKKEQKAGKNSLYLQNVQRVGLSSNYAPSREVEVSPAINAPIAALDDSILDLELLRLCHKRARVDAPFLSFTDPMELEAYVSEAAQGRAPMPCFLLIDIRMPAVDGFQVLTRLRRVVVHLPPAALYTTSAHPQDVRRASEEGCELIIKSAKFQESVELIQRLAAEGKY
jgi:CheY-like chemotaxis protein